MLLRSSNVSRRVEIRVASQIGLWLQCGACGPLLVWPFAAQKAVLGRFAVLGCSAVLGCFAVLGSFGHVISELYVVMVAT